MTITSSVCALAAKSLTAPPADALMAAVQARNNRTRARKAEALISGSASERGIDNVADCQHNR